MKKSLVGMVCLITSVLSFSAAAQEVRSTKWVNLRAGPARDYPLVMPLGPGTLLAVEGCTSGFGWCDVIAPGEIHGWIYAGNLSSPYQNAEVPLLDYGAMLGYPIVTFALGNYWNQYYRNRPWYGERSQWAHRSGPGATIGRGAGPPRARMSPEGRGAPPQGVRPSGGGGPPQGARPQRGAPPQGMRPPGVAGPGLGMHPEAGGGRPQGASPPQGMRAPGLGGPGLGMHPEAGGSRPQGDGGGPQSRPQAGAGARPQGGGGARDQGRPNRAGQAQH